MDIGTMLSDSLNYAIDAVWQKWVRWILLIVSMIIFPLILGYVMEIYRGTKPAPELQHWVKLFIDGLKLIVAWIIYMIPVFAVLFISGGWALFSAIQQSAPYGGPDALVRYPYLFLPVLAGLLIGFIVAIVLAIVISLIATIGIIRMARTDRFSEAFNFGGILTTIRHIGWGSYIIALIVLFIVMLVFSFILAITMAIPYIGWIIYFIILPPLSIFQARYLTLLYESSEPAAPVMA